MQCELLSLLPEVRSQVHEATSNQWVPWVSAQTAPTNQNFVDAFTSIELEDEEEDQVQCEATRLDAPTNLWSIPQWSISKIADIRLV